MTDALPSFALAEPHFPLRALAAAVAKAPLGGAREALMATLVAARLAATSTGPSAVPTILREERAAAARHWLGALSLGAPVRVAVVQLLESTVGGDPAVIAATLGKVTDVTAAHLDRKARSELDRLVRALND